MKTPCRILAFLLTACLMPPVFAGKVKTQLAPNADFSRYQTFQWLPPRVLTNLGVVEDHPANPILKEAIGQQMAKKGLRELADDADLQIQVFVLTDTSPQLEAIIIGVMPGVNYGTQVATIGRYNRSGSLYINLIDRRTKKSAWLGMTTDSLSTGTLKPEEIRSKLTKAINNIFKKYPVKKK